VSNVVPATELDAAVANLVGILKKRRSPLCWQSKYALRFRPERRQPTSCAQPARHGEQFSGMRA
jgi:hypothetical protein